MSSPLSSLPPYEPTVLPYTTDSQKSHIINNDIIDTNVEKYFPFLDEVFQELKPSKNSLTIENIGNILNKYDFQGGRAHIRDNKILNIMHQLQLMQPQTFSPEVSQSKRNELIENISEQLKTIHHDIRNQTLYRKSSSAQLAAATAIPEKKSVTDGELTTSTSYAEMWLRLAFFIGEVKQDYVDFYADLMQKYTEMYESFNENVQKASSDAVSTGDDGNNIAFDTNKMQAGYDAFQQDVDRLNEELGSVDGWNTMSDDEKRRMVITLEPAYKVDKTTGKISFNMDQYQSVSGSYPSGIKDGKVSTASYQAWLATFNAAGNAFQSNMQSFAQRYSQANNNFDTLNKILSSAISTLADSARDVLKSL